ncbi:unnamed protein product [Bursaphelenchus okinawaensis]|uniref:Uncharacterized protein n=1 Tax=Bursaphelenchus okinawaensis TaxID=465554 RepID=A0A811LNK3_9BILA|nr:unnamed protein product [Bursaphelenchus okinawaensis]CAG9124512.1 unnamed protein product [Bursaphelenchus okinawaensis]
MAASEMSIEKMVKEKPKGESKMISSMEKDEALQEPTIVERKRKLKKEKETEVETVKEKPEETKQDEVTTASAMTDVEDEERRKIVRKYMIYLGVLVSEAVLMTIVLLVGVVYVAVFMS